MGECGNSHQTPSLHHHLRAQPLLTICLWLTAVTASGAAPAAGPQQTRMSRSDGGAAEEQVWLQ